MHAYYLICDFVKGDEGGLILFCFCRRRTVHSTKGVGALLLGREHIWNPPSSKFPLASYPAMGPQQSLIFLFHHVYCLVSWMFSLIIIGYSLHVNSSSLVAVYRTTVRKLQESAHFPGLSEKCPFAFSSFHPFSQHVFPST